MGYSVLLREPWPWHTRDHISQGTEIVFQSTTSHWLQCNHCINGVHYMVGRKKTKQNYVFQYLTTRID